MRCYECECKHCHQHAQLHFQEPYPEYGDEFQHFCSHCGMETVFTRTLTKKKRCPKCAGIKLSLI